MRSTQVPRSSIWGLKSLTGQWGAEDREYDLQMAHDAREGRVTGQWGAEDREYDLQMAHNAREGRVTGQWGAEDREYDLQMAHDAREGDLLYDNDVASEDLKDIDCRLYG